MSPSCHRLCSRDRPAPTLPALRHDRPTHGSDPDDAATRARSARGARVRGPCARLRRAREAPLDRERRRWRGAVSELGCAGARRGGAVQLLPAPCPVDRRTELLQGVRGRRVEPDAGHVERGLPAHGRDVRRRRALPVVLVRVGVVHPGEPQRGAGSNLGVPPIERPQAGARGLHVRGRGEARLVLPSWAVVFGALTERRPCSA